jgi:hypothetical protein
VKIIKVIAGLICLAGALFFGFFAWFSFIFAEFWFAFVLTFFTVGLVSIGLVLIARYRFPLSKHTKKFTVGFFGVSILLPIITTGYISWSNRSDLKPNVFATTMPRWLFDSGYRFDFNESKALVISNWITNHQSGWKRGSTDDFSPHKIQFSADNYSIQIDTNEIVFQYYKTEYDYTNDPSDSFIVIKRALTSDEHSFWETQVAQIKAP